MLEAKLFFWIMVALQLLDAATTIAAISKGGAEANPILSKLMEKIGVTGALMLLKAIFLVYLWFNPIEVLIAQVVIIALFVGVAINNLIVLKKLSK